MHRKTLLGVALLTAGVVTGTGCGPKPYVQVRRDGLYYTHYFYLVKFLYPKTRHIVSGKWFLDNFHEKESKWVMNKGKRYYGTYLIDRDGDGEYEKEKAYIFDLKLDHRHSQAVLWIQNRELSYKHADKDLDVFLSNYVRSLTGAGFYAESNMFTVMTVKQKRYAAAIRSKSRVRLGPYPAVRARIQIYNMDRRRLNPDDQGDMIEVTIAKVYFKYYWPSSGSHLIGRSVMIVGYYNNTSRFDQSYADYLTFLGRIHFNLPKKR